MICQWWIFHCHVWVPEANPHHFPLEADYPMVIFRAFQMLWEKLIYLPHLACQHVTICHSIFARLNQLDRSWGGIAAVNLCTMSDFYSAQSCPIHNFMWGTSKRPLQEFTAECRYLSDQKQTNLTRRHRFKLTATSCCVSFIVCSCCYTSWKRCRRHGDSAFVQLSSQIAIMWDHVKGSPCLRAAWISPCMYCAKSLKWRTGKHGNTEKSIVSLNQFDTIRVTTLKHSNVCSIMSTNSFMRLVLDIHQSMEWHGLIKCSHISRLSVQ